jgi:hypothetical protein
MIVVRKTDCQPAVDNIMIDGTAVLDRELQMLTILHTGSIFAGFLPEIETAAFQLLFFVNTCSNL